MSRNEITQLNNKVIPLRPFLVNSQSELTDVVSIEAGASFTSVVSEIVQNTNSQVECADGVCEIRWKPAKIA